MVNSINRKNYYIGLDVGTNSVGYAVTDKNYNLLKKHGEPMWGSMVFEAANTKAERRNFRAARRRLDRRQQRIALLQEIFAHEIAKVDEKFYLRIKESFLYREDTTSESRYFLFEDKNFNDIDYNKQYPTIHHLIQDLILNPSEKDVRLVYLACAWFMAHRGHFLNEVDKKNIEAVLDFHYVYDGFISYWENHYFSKIWNCDEEDFKSIMRMKVSVTRKEKAFLELLNQGKKFKTAEEDSISKDAVIKLLAGGKIKLNKVILDIDEENAESISLSMPEENFQEVVASVGEYGELFINLRKIYDWALLEEILAGEKTLSAAKVKIYNQHKQDLKNLKAFVRKYIPEKYNLIFRDINQMNYAAYSGHNCDKKCNKEVFSEFLKKQLSGIEVFEEDETFYHDFIERVELHTFMPKQVDGDNRVIPYQLYWNELAHILKNASNYLPFLNEIDESGISNSEKILSIFEFRVPYYVGPLNSYHSENSWMKRKEGMEGKIYPWNFNDMVDLDASEQTFIRRMTNKCTYLPAESVIPKCSLLYSKFIVLNEINNICVNGQSIPVKVKQMLYGEFMKHKKVSRRMIEDFLRCNGCMQKGDILSGIDQNIHASLTSYHAFRKLLESKKLSEKDVERIIEYLSYSEDRRRQKKWLFREYPQLPDEDIKYILHIKIKDFGRLSEKLLVGIRGIDKNTGEIMTIMDALWETNDNLMKLLSNRYTFAEEIEAERKAFYEGANDSIDSILDSMYISNSVKRPIYRALAIVSDVKKATKMAPERIFIEMARGGGEKGKRTQSRRKQIEELYARLDKSEVRELSKLLDSKTDNELQSEVLFLYFMQLGKCMYSMEDIDIEQLKSNKYNVDHIYPQSKVKDDSLTNKVLVLSELNGIKGDQYPINAEWRHKMASFWKMLKERGLISEVKYQRLMRGSDFTEEELQGFINRQLVETRQSTKALATILEKIYPETQIVYVKAGLVSDFRHDFDMLKSRQVNDLHHGKDAYLNIVCGNVYYCRFAKNFRFNKPYSLKTKTIFTHSVYEGENIVWSGENDIARIKKVMQKNNLHYTRFVFERKGGLFDQNPVKAGKGAVPLKANLPIEKYGGYNKSTASYFLLVKYKEKKKVDVMVMPVELWRSESIMQDENSAMKYAKKNIAVILGKDERDIEILDLPLGLRKIKVNTILSLDGYRVAITGKSSGGTRLLITSMESLIIGAKKEYVKHLERFIEKYNAKRLLKIDSVYDHITYEDNKELYEILLKKAGDKQFGKLFASVYDYMLKGQEKFEKASLEDQSQILMNIVNVFKTGRAGGCDLTKIGGVKSSGALVISAKLSNWKKTYNDVHIIDVSSSGIYETRSRNLLEVL